MGLMLLFAFALLLLWLLGAAGLVYALGHPRRKTYAVALGKGDPTDPADLELEAQEVTFSLSDGKQSPGWVIEGVPGNIDGNDSAGITVVLVHGFGNSRYGSLRRAPLLVRFARRVVVFDLPGQGESQARRGYGGLREPDDVLAVLGQLEEQDAKRVVLLGSSMGAGIAIAAAAKAADQTRRSIVGVIAESPYRQWDDPLHNYFRHHRYPRRPIIWLAWLWIRMTVKGFKDFDRAKHAGRLGCPLLVLHGSQDKLCPITSAIEIAEAAPDSRFIEIEGGAHNNLTGDYEQAYEDAVGCFLKGLCSGEGSGKIEGLADTGHPRSAASGDTP